MTSPKEPRTVAEVVEILRRGSKLSFVIEDGEAMLEAALIIENLQSQLAELLPYVEKAERWGAGEPNAGQFKSG